MLRFVALLLAVLTTNASSAGLPCEELRSRIAAKLEARHVRNYVLSIVPNAEASSRKGKVVGTCEGGTRKILYTRTGAGAPERPGSREQAAPGDPQGSRQPGSSARDSQASDEAPPRGRFDRLRIVSFEGAPPVLRFGMTVDEVDAELGVRLELGERGECLVMRRPRDDEPPGDSPAWRFWFLRERLVHIEAGADAQTDLGVATGDPLGDVRAAYYGREDMKVSVRLPDEEGLLVSVARKGSRRVLSFRSDAEWKEVVGIAAGVEDASELCRLEAKPRER